MLYFKITSVKREVTNALKQLFLKYYMSCLHMQNVTETHLPWDL